MPKLEQGLLAVSVDLELPIQGLATESNRQLEHVTDRLLAIFTRYGIVATWAVADPVQSAATAKILATGDGHEIAVQGDSTWLGSAAGRSRFGRELSRRVLRARAEGIPATSLVPCDVALDDHLDLVVKHGMTAVRGQLDGNGRSRLPAQPHALHFGLWEIPGSIELPGSSKLWPGGGNGFRVRRGIQRAIARQQMYHLVINAPKLSRMGRGSLKVIESIARLAARRQASGTLQVVTLATAASQLSEPLAISPSRSILRSA